MATSNNPISALQLKKSVFNIKNYVDNNKPRITSEETIFSVTAEQVQAGIQFATDNLDKLLWENCLFETEINNILLDNQVVYLEYQGYEFLSQLEGNMIKFFTFSSIEDDYDDSWTMPKGQILCMIYIGKDIDKQDNPNKCYVRLWTSTTDITGITLKIKNKNSIDNELFDDDANFWNSISMNRSKNTNIGKFSIALGEHAEASYSWSIALGNDVHARGNAAISLGQQNISQGTTTTTLGYGNRALSNYSYAQGRSNLASAAYTSATGYKTKATGTYARSSGAFTTASGSASIADGNSTTASGVNSHSEGNNTIASGQNQHVEGKFNIQDTNNKYAHIVGNGTSASSRSNAYTLDWSGNGIYSGKLTVGIEPSEDKDLTTKKYVDDKVAGIVDSAPETLDTLNELSKALGDDPNFATTVATQIGNKVDKEDGKVLTTNDLTNELKTNYDAAYEYSQAKHSYNDLTDLPTIPSIEGLATQAYVDNKKYNDLIEKPIIILPYETSVSNGITYKNSIINVATLEGNKIYMTAPDVTNLFLQVENLNGTLMTHILFLGKTSGSTLIHTGAKNDKKIEVIIEGDIYTFYFKTDTEDAKVEKSIRYLSNKNTIEYTPTGDYNPATKKYADDIKASIVVPTKTSELTNDSNFLTEHQSLDGYAKTSDIPSIDGLATQEFVSNAISEANDIATDDEVKNAINAILGGDYVE